MAHTLKLTLGGSTIDLNSGSSKMLEYIPREPNLSTIDDNTILRDGGERFLTSRRNVLEDATIQFRGTAASNVTATKHKITQWFDYASRRQETRTGSRVYVEYAPDGLSASVYRSEILGGKTFLEDESLDYRWTQSRAMQMRLQWSRRYFWEGDELDLHMYNGSSGTDASSMSGEWAIVHNSCSSNWAGASSGASPNNFVNIHYGEVKGEIPTPLRLEYFNDNSTTMNTGTIVAFHNRLSSPTSLKNIFEAEDSEGVTSSSAKGWSDTDYSHLDAWEAHYRTADVGSWADICRITIPASDMQAMNGNTMSVWVKTSTGGSYESASPFVRCAIDNPTLYSAIQSSYEVEPKTDIEFQSWGRLRFPPSSVFADTTGDLVLSLQLKSYSASATVIIDFVQISPLDGHRYLAQLSHQYSASTLIIDDNYENQAWLSLSDYSDARSVVFWAGYPIRLYPNEAQRLQFNFLNNNDYEVGRRFRVRATYRPRRLTV